MMEFCATSFHLKKTLEQLFRLVKPLAGLKPMA